MDRTRRETPLPERTEVQTPQQRATVPPVVVVRPQAEDDQTPEPVVDESTQPSPTEPYYAPGTSPADLAAAPADEAEEPTPDTR